MSDHPSFELLKKPDSSREKPEAILLDLNEVDINNLDKLEIQLKTLTEQVQDAKNSQFEQILTLLQTHIRDTGRNLEEEHEVLVKLKESLKQWVLK